MKALARPGVARVPGGRATPGHEPDEWNETLINLGYIWCRPCDGWHRGEECWIDENGRSALDIAINSE